jgi:hypothetical protein
MNLTSTLTLFLLSAVVQVHSFAPTNLSISSSTCSTPTLTLTPAAAATTTTTSTKLNALTAEDILKRARKSAGVEEEAEPEPIFTDTILTDFQEALLLLEKRVKEGPASLNSNEIYDLENRLNRILLDIKTYDGGNSSNTPSMLNSAAAAPVAAAAPPAPSAPVATVSTYTPQASTTAEENNEDGEAYNGEGGLGLAKGTANTWALEGMEEMSPEEYRQALQDSVSARQAERRQQNLRSTGNLSSNNYLDGL